MHYINYYNNWSMPWGPYQLFWGIPMFFVGAMFLVLLVWSLYWKARALWRAARLGEKGWFVAMLVINTAGILEILYLYVLSKDKK